MGPYRHRLLISFNKGLPSPPTAPTGAAFEQTIEAVPPRGRLPSGLDLGLATHRDHEQETGAGLALLTHMVVVWPFFL